MDPSVSLRRVDLALRGLPMGVWPDAESPASWHVSDYLLANLIDAVRELTWVVARTNGAKAKKPDPVYRPGSRRPGKPAQKRGSWAEFARSLIGGGGDG